MPKGWFSGEGLLFPLPARFKPSKQTELNRAKTIGTTMAQPKKSPFEASNE